MKKVLHTLDEAAALIRTGKYLCVAAEEPLLRRLPRGNWIGGTIPYFVAEDGGVETRDKVYITEFETAGPKNARLRIYSKGDIHEIAKDGPDNGFTFVVMPAACDIATEFAVNSWSYDDMFVKPVVGWLTGVHLSELGKGKPKVFHGQTGQVFDDKAIAMHVTLPLDKRASIQILNLFEQGEGGDVITFPTASFTARECFVNGRQVFLSDYLRDADIDIKRPFMANYHGAGINVAIANVDHDKKEVSFYAPTFEGVEYRQAAPVTDYVQAFDARLSELPRKAEFACNCILNYLYAELNGRKTSGVTYPFTFGEIGYQLLNQTLVTLEISDV